MKRKIDGDIDDRSPGLSRHRIRDVGVAPLTFPTSLTGSWPAPDHQSRHDLHHVQAMDTMIKALPAVSGQRRKQGSWILGKAKALFGRLAIGPGELFTMSRSRS